MYQIIALLKQTFQFMFFSILRETLRRRPSRILIIFNYIKVLTERINFAHQISAIAQ
jgi:hypothetical protein